MPISLLFTTSYLFVLKYVGLTTRQGFTTCVVESWTLFVMSHIVGFGSMDCAIVVL